MFQRPAPRSKPIPPSALSTSRPNPEPVAAARPQRAAALRRAAACRAAHALRLPARVRRRPEVVGRAEGALARPGRQAPRRARPRTIRTTTRRSRASFPPKQYGAGEVIVWDCGVYSPDEGGVPGSTTAREARAASCATGSTKGKLSILLRGEKLKGSFALVRTQGREELAPDQAQGPLRRRRRRDRAGSLGADRAAPSEDMKVVPAHDASPRGAARARGPRRAAAGEARADARRVRRRAVQRRRLDVGAQARRLSRARLHRRRQGAAALAARARSHAARFRCSRRSSRSRRSTA